MTPGSIYSDHDFTFRDGARGNKILIVLGSIDGVSLVAKTTSKGRLYSHNFGCQCRDRFPNFFLVQNCCVLKEPTWVCLNEYYELADTEILRKRFNGNAKAIGSLSSTLRDSLIACALESEDITPFQESILRAT
jgi:hypothetical protein